MKGVLHFEWNKECYPFGNLNIYNLLRLDGKRDFIELLEIKLLDSDLSVSYCVNDDEIIFEDSFIRAVLEQQKSIRISIKCKIIPVSQNKSGRGLYLSGKNTNEHMVLTLMEPFGFSNIFYMQDRPDVQTLFDLVFMNHPNNNYTLFAAGEAKHMLLSEYLEKESIFDVEMIYKKDQTILLLSDSNPKPTYLFQLIFYPFDNVSELKKRGKLIEIQDSDTGTKIHVMKDSCSELDDTNFAIESIQKTILFDREYFNLEYDSSNLYLVAANDFNSGAREMRNFMVFSPSKMLSNRYISTLDDFYNVERIVAHEFLHHYSGNRVTMRDFFEVTLKEGLTVLRDMYFRESKGLFGACSRIEAVTKLRRTQWVQDSGPKAHSVRPDHIEAKSDFEVSLFTPTVYEKGAEILRMIQVLINPDINTFTSIVGQYLSGPIRHSTIDELVSYVFLQSHLKDSLSIDSFMNWFIVKGTPIVSVDWNQDSFGNWTMILTQSTSNGNDAIVVKDLLIPIQISIFSKSSNEELTDYSIIHHTSGIESIRNGLFLLKDQTAEVTLKFNEIAKNDVLIPSINRSFTAPIKIDYKFKYEAHFIAKFETDMLSRFDAVQHLIKLSIFSLYEGRTIDTNIRELVDLIRSRLQKINNSTEENIWNLFIRSRILSEQSREQEKLELALSLEEIYLSNLVEEFDKSKGDFVNPVRLSEAREAFRKSFSRAMFNFDGPENLYYAQWEVLTVELDPFKYPGSVKLEQVFLRSFLSSISVAESLGRETKDPSMERQIALLECQYQLSNDHVGKEKLLSNFNDFISLKAKDHPVAKEKLFKFMILKSTTADELKRSIEKFSLLNGTQPQSLKLFAKEFASNNLSVFHSVEGLKLMADVILKCDSFGNHETAATLIKHSFEVNLLNLDFSSRQRVSNQLHSILACNSISTKLEGAVKSLAKKIAKT